MNPALSIIIPAKDEAESLPELIEWINRVCTGRGLSFEALIIDDGSEDATWETIVQLHSRYPQVRGIRFNRNFGKSAALNTGFKLAHGQVVITMDADLQDSPDEIPALYDLITHDGYHLVSGWKKKRYDPLSKTIPSKVFNYVTRKISGIPLHDFNCGLKAYQGKVVKNISVYGEMHRYIPMIAKWAGYTRITEKVVEHRERKYGHTKFGLERFITGFLDLLSITFVSRFRQRPMHFFGTLGTLSFLTGFLLTGKLLWDKMESIWITHQPLKRDVTEQPVFYLALVVIIIGVQLFVTGFLAELLAMHNAPKREYLIAEKVGLDS